MAQPVCTYDFTLREEGVDRARLISVLKECSKKWTFQLEQGGETGYVHYQGRFSLKMKARAPQAKNFFTVAEMPEVHLSVTSNANRDNCFYVLKQEGRLDGPWCDTDMEVPRDVQEMELWPWQQRVVDSIQTDNDRTINIVVDTVGDIGKTQLVRWVICRKVGNWIPATIEKADDLMQWVGDMPKARLYLIDIPRAINQKTMRSLYAAIETIKGGLAYDHRYHGRQYVFDKPAMWVFCNTEPDQSLLSADRWKYWRVCGGQLMRY